MNTFTCTWINRLDQFGATDITLVVVHDQGVIPPRRAEKSYNLPYESVDVDFLSAEATKEVELTIAEWEAAQSQQPEVP